MKHLFLTAALFIVMLNANAQSLQSGGGEYKIAKTTCISAEQHAVIEQQLKRSMVDLQQKGILPQTFSPQVVLFDFPLKQAPGYNYNSVYGISNYFDLNLAFPNQITDYNCGTRSYDTNTGYNHQGIDYFLWPFDNLMMNREQVQIVAAQEGTILFKSNGNSDQNCSFCSGCNWNAVYIVHSDGSVAWYGHMKNNSLTTKAVGATVAKGEYLGAVGSSGNSTGPHLHFEVYKAQPYTNANLIDPNAGPCNTRNTESWWASQRPYLQPTINHIQTQSAPTVFNACPAPETTNESNQFAPGNTVYFTAYYTDQFSGTIASYTITRPDNSVFQSWTQNFTSTFAASWWWRDYVLPTNAPTGTWNFKVDYNGQTVNYPFIVSAPTGVNDINGSLMKMRLFPNPVANEVNISVEDLIKNPVIIINNLQGQIIFRKEFNQPQKNFLLYLPQLAKGTYVLMLMDGTKKVAQQKIIK